MRWTKLRPFEPRSAVGSPLERRFEEFLKGHEPGLKGRVERAFKQWNNILRDYLRNETGLRLTVGDDTQAVPVRIDDGLPVSFARFVETVDERTWSLLLNRGLLQEGVRATKFVQRGFEWISKWCGGEPSAAEYDEFRHVFTFLYVLLRRLRGLDFIEKMKAIQEDVLGAYFFRVPEVHLYWMVIGFLSGVLGVSVEALTVVVAAHELAHAYTHLGRDIGRREVGNRELRSRQSGDHGRLGAVLHQGDLQETRYTLPGVVGGLRAIAQASIRSVPRS